MAVDLLRAWVRVDGVSYRVGVWWRDKGPGVMLGLEPGGLAASTVWRRFNDDDLAALLAGPHRSEQRP